MFCLLCKFVWCMYVCMVHVVHVCCYTIDHTRHQQERIAQPALRNYRGVLSSPRRVWEGDIGPPLLPTHYHSHRLQSAIGRRSGRAYSASTIAANMVASCHMLVVACALFAILDLIDGYKVEKYSLLMPDVRPNQPELYLCTPIKVDPSKPYYIVGFEPNATMSTAHHMLLYGCTSPGSQKSVWNCGEMAEHDDTLETSNPCGKGSQIIYAWARDAPKLELPEGVGFMVGGNSPIQYLVLQVHYAHIEKFRDGSTDNSGVFLHYTERPLNKLAGVILLGTAGEIPPKAVEHMETSCKINEKKTIYPFAYRTHTHSLGKVVSGYKVRKDENGKDHWVLLGKRNPLTPQMFYPVLNKEPIGYGDKLAARCTMHSERSHYTEIGPTNNDEMCNFYLMYWVENDTPLNKKYCFSMGPPNYYWETAHEFNFIPDNEASTL